MKDSVECVMTVVAAGVVLRVEVVPARFARRNHDDP